MLLSSYIVKNGQYCMLLFQRKLKYECDHVLIKTAVQNENENKTKDREKARAEK